VGRLRPGGEAAGNLTGVSAMSSVDDVGSPTSASSATTAPCNRYVMAVDALISSASIMLIRPRSRSASSAIAPGLRPRPGSADPGSAHSLAATAQWL
jgi:hypothetical protein